MTTDPFFEIVGDIDMDSEAVIGITLLVPRTDLDNFMLAFNEFMELAPLCGSEQEITERMSPWGSDTFEEFGATMIVQIARTYQQFLTTEQ